MLVFCVGGAVGAAAKPADTETVKRTQTETTERVQTETQTQTQTQTVKTPSPDQGSAGPTVAGAAASSPAPSSRSTPAGAASALPSGNCDPGYGPICLDPTVSDYDCLGKGDGPKYVDGPVTVVGSDRWELDEADNDGLACE